MPETKTEVVKFANLSDYCIIRPTPLNRTMIAKKTLAYGRAFSRPSVSYFFSGALNINSPAFKVIRRTIEGTLDILIDFSESNYDA